MWRSSLIKSLKIYVYEALLLNYIEKWRSVKPFSREKLMQESRVSHAYL